jgi:hypothetical protein
MSWVNLDSSTPAGGDNHTISIHMQNNDGWRIYTSGDTGKLGIWVRNGYNNVQSNRSSVPIDVGS